MLVTFKKVLQITALLGLSCVCSAQEAPAPQNETTPVAPRVGVGQPDASTPALLGRMQLNDPLVQQKYLNDPDMLRFLRATYSEACARGNLVEMAKSVKGSNSDKVSDEVKKTLSAYLASQRIWKMSTFEMETLFGKSYIETSFYCDCLMKEVSNLDLVNPRKSMGVVKELKPASTKMCLQLAEEKTKKYTETLPENFKPKK